MQPVIRCNISEQLLQHDTCVFAGEVVGSLSNVHRDVSGLFPKAEQFRTTFRQSLKERRHLIDVPDSDGVGLQCSVLVELVQLNPNPIDLPYPPG
jgi:hypothetical protein